MKKIDYQILMVFLNKKWIKERRHYQDIIWSVSLSNKIDLDEAEEVIKSRWSMNRISNLKRRGVQLAFRIGDLEVTMPTDMFSYPQFQYVGG